jgi:phenylacetate-coenzyme A ligase PaaK-like adenylate-forming protein
LRNATEDISVFEDSVFRNASSVDFNAKALQLFHFQYQNNGIYREFCDLLKINPENILSSDQIPFLPIRFFKSKRIICAEYDNDKNFSFTSSGTTGAVPSTHYVSKIELYEKSFLKAFELFYGKPEEWVILALLPSYLERSGSSLVYMTQKLIEKSNHRESGFYLKNYGELADTLKNLDERKQKTLLIGVSFALLDFSEQFSMPLQHTIIMETGGMKGRREELIREELHSRLKKAFALDKIHSEYGMTELLSQAYAQSNGLFNCPPWMKIKITSLQDPNEFVKNGQTGKINIIDLANIYSCPFIASDDIGIAHSPDSFEVLGRSDHSDLRGCSLLIAGK